MSDILQLCNRAYQSLQAGRYAEAETLCRDILKEHPQNIQALCLFSAARFYQGDLVESEKALVTATTLDPRHVATRAHYARFLLTQQRHEDACVQLRAALQVEPTNVKILGELAGTLHALGRTQEATEVQSYANQLLASTPTGQAAPSSGVSKARSTRRTLPSSRPLLERLQELLQAGRLDTAETLLKTAQADRALLAEGYAHLGVARHIHKQYAAAVSCFAKATELQPDNPGYFADLALAQITIGQLEQAIQSCHYALARDASSVRAYTNLAIAHGRLQQFAEAEAARRQALQRDPHNMHALLATANIFMGQGRFQEAIQAAEQAIRADPENVEAHVTLGTLLLELEQYPGGWSEYEWRAQSFPPRTRPRWDGSPLNGRTILVHAEGGVGDTIQFVRFLPLVQQRGGRVLLEYQPPLTRLLETASGYDLKVARGPEDPLTDLPHDVQILLMSLPGTLGVAPDAVPVPYLAAEPDKIAAWRERLQDDARFRVGIVWRGNPTYLHDAYRSCKLSHFLPLADIPGVRLYSLQISEAPPDNAKVVNLAPELHDFADTAAALSVLDLLITVDTSVAHLAGAIGRPVWTLIDAYSDWRWLRDRSDTPWYPTMRLFRQKTPCDWQSVLTEVEQALRALVS